MDESEEVWKKANASDDPLFNGEIIRLSDSKDMDPDAAHSEAESITEKGHVVELKKSLGLVSGIGMIVGTMIGSGIFVSPKGVLEGAGSVGMSFVIWVMCGLLSTCGALCYAELGTSILKSGCEHAYLMHAFSGMSPVFGRIPAFLYDWVGTFIIRPVMFAGIALSLGAYVVKPFFAGCEPPEEVLKITTIMGMMLLTIINCYSVRLATAVQIACTVAKLLAISIITVSGIYMLAKGNTRYISEGFQDTGTSPAFLVISFYNGLWAFEGWNNLNFVTEELQNPKRNLPLCIIIGIPLTLTCYVLANVGYFSVMSKEEILVSHAVGVVWAEYMLGVMAWMMPIFIVMSCFGSANGCLFATGRLEVASMVYC